VGALTITAWQHQQPYPSTDRELLARRNPFYWMVDTLGQQLPYLDEVQFTVVSDGDPQ
jgi:peptide/nickel transport system substrate-binding protein